MMILSKYVNKTITASCAAFAPVVSATYLNLGLANDYTIIAPSYRARFDPSTSLMDMLFWGVLTSGNN